MIDDKTYALSVENYISDINVKSQIILAHTFNHDMRHVKGWLHRYHGKYKKTAPFTISKDGVVYQHFDPKFSSLFFKSKEQNKKSIVILLENDGWLLKDIKNNAFITWIGDIYNQNDVVEKKWRDYSLWASYSDKQFNSTIKLVKNLCKTFNIPMTSINHNTKVDNLVNYEGVLYKSNIERHFTDLNPSWDCELFKNKLEN